MLPKIWKQVIGAAIGVVIGLLMLLIGFWTTLLVCVLAALGWRICGGCVVSESVIELLEKIKQMLTRK